MLSRVAESLYWMARYVERAEDLTRLLSVNFHAQLDRQAARGLPGANGWQSLIAITGDAPNFAQHFPVCDAPSVVEFFLWHAANPNAVLACITLARENARSVREQISSEMWEHINRLYFLARNADQTAVLHGPHEFFRQVRDGSQAFQGIAEATMTHGEAYEFIQLGKYLERAEKTIRILDVKYAEAAALPDDSPAAALHLIALLRSCSAFEPFRKAHASQLLAWRVAEYLLLNQEFPRAVAFGVTRCLRSAIRLSDSAPRPNTAQRRVDRLRTDLDYLDIQEVSGDRMHPYLSQLLRDLNLFDEAVTSSFFNTQVVLPGQPGQQQMQQQQQQ